jgi:hypothetical protein
MTLDARLRRAIDTAGDRLREEVVRELQAVFEETAPAPPAASRTLAPTAAVPPPIIQQPGDAAPQLLEALALVDAATSLTGILDALLTIAHGNGARAAGIFLVQDGRLRVWRLRGFGSDPGALDGTELGMDEAGIIATAVASRQGVTAADSRVSWLASFSTTAGSAGTAVPLVVASDVVAVLYVEEVAAGSGRGELPIIAVEIAARYAARTSEALTAFRMAQAAAGLNGGQDDDAARRGQTDADAYRESAVAVGRK